MRSTVLSLLLIATTPIIVHAQLGFEGGLNMANLDIVSNGNTVGTAFKYGAAFGIIADVGIGGGHFYLEPGAYYQNSGATITDNPKGKYEINSFNFPLYIEYKTGERCGARFFVGAGPYISDNINGAYDITGGNGVPATTADIKIGVDFKQTDWGVGFNTGYIGNKHFYLKAHYQVGLANELQNGDSKNSIKQSSGGIVIGYFIRGCNRGSWSGGGRRGGNHWRGVKKGRWSTKQKLWRAAGPAYY